MSYESSLDRHSSRNTGPDQENSQIAPLCCTPRLLQARTCLLFSSQPYFRLPPHLSFFYSFFSKGLGPRLSLHTPAPPSGPQGTSCPALGIGSFPTSVKASSCHFHFHLAFLILHQNPLNPDSADLFPGISLNKLEIVTGSLEPRVRAEHPSLPYSAQCESFASPGSLSFL